MNRLLWLILIAGVSACSSDGEERAEYLDSYSVKALEIPPKLTQIENRNELDIPQPSEKAMTLLEQREDVEGSVSPVFKGLKIRADQGMNWLEIEESAEQLWPVLLDFLAHEGIKVYRNEPLLGFMETEWVKEYQKKAEGNFLSNIFNIVSPDVLDKFRIRVERVPGAKLSKVFVSHRGLEIAMVGEEGSRWQQRDSEPVLERELLYRLVLFTGLNNKQADEIFADYRPYQERVRLLNEEASEFEIVGQPDFVWYRIMQALDRLGVEITEQNRQQGKIHLAVGELPEALITERDELAESSWLMNLFKGTDTEHSDQKGRVNIALKLQPSGNVTHMQISHVNGDRITTGLSAQFRDSLIMMLK